MEAQSPIPSPLPNDDEDVSWALSTAGALWGRGERIEALKWLRRAAEQASDSNDDVRALALFKAAAEATPHATTTTPPSTTAAPPVASVLPPSTTSAPPQSGSFPPPSQSAAAPPPPPRKGPPSLPPRNSRPPPMPSTRTPSAPQAPQSAAPQTTPLPASQLAPPQTEPLPQAQAPQMPQMPQAPQARGRPAPSANVPSPVTKPSQAAPPQSAMVARPQPASPQPASPLADASTLARRPEPQRAPAPVRPSPTTPGVTVPTRPVAFSRPAAIAPQAGDAATRTIVTTPQPRPAGAKGSASATTTPLPGAAVDRAPASRRGRVFDEITALGGTPGQKFDDLDENTQVIQAAKSVPINRKSTAQEIEESFRGLLVDVPTGAEAESSDEPTDPGLHAHPNQPPPEDATQPISAPSPRTAPWSAEERSAISSPDSHGPELTSRRFAPLLAHRVAIVASSTPGELRVVPLDTSRAPPPGAAIVLIVPLSGADDHVITQLLGSLE